MHNLEQVNHYGERPDVIDFNKKYDLNFNLGSAVKYIARAGKKANESKKKDLIKAIDCIKRELDTNIGKWYHVNGGAGILKWNDGEITEGVWDGDYGTNWHFSTLEGAVEASAEDVFKALGYV